MPQIFQVLRCYKCSIFQVHQTRKDNKWICKICGEKQSVKRHYGLGTSKDCRTHVQKLNKMRGEKDEAPSNVIDSEDSEYDENIVSSTNNVCETKISKDVSKESKWSIYIDKAEQNFEISESVHLNDREVVIEIPQKRKMNRKYQQLKYFKKLGNNEDNCKVKISNQLENQIDPIATCTMNVDLSGVKNFDSEMQEVCVKSKVKSHIDTNISSQTRRLQLIPQNVNKGSKWAQFIDTEVIDGNDDKNTEKNCNKHPLFSLCDDSEIDTILDL